MNNGFLHALLTELAKVLIILTLIVAVAYFRTPPEHVLPL